MQVGAGSDEVDEGVSVAVVDAIVAVAEIIMLVKDSDNDIVK